MTSFLIQMAFGLAGYFLVTRVLYPRWPVATTVLILAAFIYNTVHDIMTANWPWVPVDIAGTLIFAWRLRRDWRNRKRRKLAQKLGYKALALRAKLVETMKERRQPRRVLRPSPSPA